MKHLTLAAAITLLTAALPQTARAQIDADFFNGGAIRVGASATTCSGTAAGGIRYNSAGAGSIEFCNGTTWANVGSGGGGGAALSGITAATAANTINNANFAQSWGWNSLTTGNALSIGSSSMTTGSVMYLSSTRNNATTTGNVLRLDTTGASSQAVPLMISNAGTGLSLRVNDDGTITDSSPFVINNAGLVGIGTATPAAKLDVEGAVQIGDNSELCNAATHVGAIRFNTGTFSICRDYTIGWEPLVGAGAGGACDTTQTYSSPGTFSYVVPPAYGVITIRLWGGGGGGGGASFGACCGGDGGAGGDSSILSRSLLATGGGGGGGTVLNTPTGLGGAGGTASGGNININGSAGGAGINSVSSGIGANAPNGGTGGAVASSDGPGYSGTSPGAGGSGGFEAGGGPSEAGGGGSGAYVEKTYTPATLTPGTTINDIVVGIRGTMGVSDVGSTGGYGGYGRVSIICTSSGNPSASGGDDQIAFFSGGTLTSTYDFVYKGTGRVGIGVSNPQTSLDIASAVKIGNSAQTCAGALDGAIRYASASSPPWEYCNGSAWTPLGASAAVAINDLTDGISNGTSTVFLGNGAGAASTGASNTAIGVNALKMNTTGANNVALGTSALQANTTPSGQVAIGYNALLTAATATGNTAIGFEALKMNNNAGVDNTAIGYSVLDANTGGSYNVGLGREALGANTLGEANLAIGSSALENNTIGNNNIAIGIDGLSTNVAKSENVAIGYQAMSRANNAGGGSVTKNTAVGAYALQGSGSPGANTGTNNTAVGHGAMKVATSGGYNLATGVDALSSLTTGADNVALGANALATITTSNGNVAVGSESALNSTSSSNVSIGYRALRNSTSGSNNVAIGYEAGVTGTANTTGSNNTFIGYQAGADANNYTNGTALGNGAVLTASNRIVLGNAAVASIYAQVTSITAISDRRHKKDIIPLDMGLAFIRQLKPVEYRFNNGDETLRYGLIAQDLEYALPPKLRALVERADPEHSLALIQKDNDKDGTYRVNYGELTGPIIKAIQEQQNIIDQQKEIIVEQAAALSKLTRDIETIKEQLKSRP